ncbi:hypothetical protein M422DRAFT_39453 [Sphaerobolus stellatus SS14]|uniref:Uncharacterized protein n=1 Tax=Sphaerobolus stellatus (strain SS14) TaxID=990650 RepID=A0A0C9U3S7_SPHS4|nr:hypothetical protein M422DRAFT_39453 [Sphaerobolus stellatus SS14]
MIPPGYTLLHESLSLCNSCTPHIRCVLRFRKEVWLTVEPSFQSHRAFSCWILPRLVLL